MSAEINSAADDHVLRVTSEYTWLTVQGEGRYTGTVSAFLRLAGCNLRCAWCDTPKSLPDYDVEAKGWGPLRTDQGSLLCVVGAVAADVKKLLDTGTRHLVITGGEPVLQQEALPPLIEALYTDTVVTVETNCTVMPSPELAKHVALASLSPKLDQVRHNDVYLAWSHYAAQIQLKIVVAQWEEFAIAMHEIETFRALRAPNLAWVAVQLESSFMRKAWSMPENAEARDRVVRELGKYNIRLVAQMHQVLRLR